MRTEDYVNTQKNKLIPTVLVLLVLDLYFWGVYDNVTGLESFAFWVLVRFFVLWIALTIGASKVCEGYKEKYEEHRVEMIIEARRRAMVFEEFESENANRLTEPKPGK